jgi:hypothetical protein
MWLDDGRNNANDRERNSGWVLFSDGFRAQRQEAASGFTGSVN